MRISTESIDFDSGGEPPGESSCGGDGSVSIDDLLDIATATTTATATDAAESTNQAEQRAEESTSTTKTTAQPKPSLNLNEIMCPITAELIAPTDVDGLIDMLERIKALDQDLQLARVQAIRALASMTEGTTKTRRVAGKVRVAKVEMPDTTWNQSKLKEAWNSYPEFAKQYLRIGSIEVQKREWKKFAGTSVVGNPPLEQFQTMVAEAEMPATANPRVTIEK